jgi:cytoskeletal protein CcmA (bactofilin family)
MSYPYPGFDVYHGSVVLPSDGDPAVAQSVDIALEALMDNSVAHRTDLAHQAADDRGKTSTITGAIVWNDGGGSVSLNLPFEVTQRTDLDETVFHGNVEVLSGSTLQVNDDATFGNTGTDQFTVNATADFNAEVSFHADVTVHTGDQLIAHGPATLDGDLVIIGENGGSTGLIVYSTAVMQTLVLNGSLQVGGNATLGSNASDNIAVKGPATFESDVTCDDDLQVNEDLAVSGDASIEGSLVVDDDITCRNLTTEGDVTLGNNSSNDTLTVTALLTGALDMGANGRVRPSTGLLSGISGGQTIGLGLDDSRVIQLSSTGAGTITMAIDDAGMGAGDSFEIYAFLTGTGTTLVVNNNLNTASVTVNTDCVVRAYRSGGGWFIAACAMVAGDHYP